MIEKLPNMYVKKLIDGIETDDPYEIKRLTEALNATYVGFAKSYGQDKTMYHIEKVAQEIRKYHPDNVLHYIYIELDKYHQELISGK